MTELRYSIEEATASGLVDEVPWELAAVSEYTFTLEKVKEDKHLDSA